MERRSFLALIASAPLAALAPWPQFLPAPRLAFHPNAIAMTMAPLSIDPVYVLSGGNAYAISRDRIDALTTEWRWAGDPNFPIRLSDADVHN